MTYLITGATGNVGGLVTKRLIERGIRPRIFVRDAEKARARYGGGVDVAVGDLSDTASLASALVGVDELFLVNSGHDLALRDRAAAEVGKLAGLRHVVKLSSFDARAQDVGTGVWHAQGEAAIRATGINFTFVQPSGFMSNALYWARSIKAEGVVRTSTGDGRIPFIHPEDIADVAVEALASHAHDGASLAITGPEALTYAEMGAKIGVAIGKTVRFEPISDEEARAQQAAWGAPETLLEARLSIFRAIRRGLLAEVTDTVSHVLGRKPIAFDRWVEQNVAAFR